MAHSQVNSADSKRYPLNPATALQSVTCTTSSAASASWFMRASEPVQPGEVPLEELIEGRLFARAHASHQPTFVRGRFRHGPSGFSSGIRGVGAGESFAFIGLLSLGERGGAPSKT